MIFKFKKHTPVIDQSSFIHPLASVTGNVRIGKNVFVGSGAVLRGDIGRIIVEDGCNVQENCVMHTFPGETTHLKKGAHIGHSAVVHGAVVGKNALIGMGAILMDHVVIGEDCIVGAGTTILEGTRIPARNVVMGNPGKVVKKVSAKMIQWKKKGTAIYVQLTKDYLKHHFEAKPLQKAKRSKSKKSFSYKTWKRTK